MARKQTTRKVAVKKVTMTAGAAKEAVLQEKKTVEKKEEKAKENLADALIMYQNDTTINLHLTNNGLTDEQKKCVATLDEAMCPLADLELSRLVLKEVLTGYMQQAGVNTLKELEGKTIENVPYMSVTRKPLKDILQARYDLGLDKPCCIMVHTGKIGKVKGLDVVIEMREAGFGGGRMERQQEIILARGQKFLVKKVAFGDEWGEAYPILHLYAV